MRAVSGNFGSNFKKIFPIDNIHILAYLDASVWIEDETLGDARTLEIAVGEFLALKDIRVVVATQPKVPRRATHSLGFTELKLKEEAAVVSVPSEKMVIRVAGDFNLHKSKVFIG